MGSTDWLIPIDLFDAFMNQLGALTGCFCLFKVLLCTYDIVIHICMESPDHDFLVRQGAE